MRYSGMPFTAETQRTQRKRGEANKFSLRRLCVLRGSAVNRMSHHHVRDLDWGAIASDDHQAGFGDVVVDAVAFEVVADEGVLGDADVLVEDGAPDFGAAADVAIVEDHALVDL